MKKFNVGDIVELREDSEYAHQSDGQHGTIIYLNGRDEDGSDDDYSYQIRWGNGHSNCYRAIDIRLVKAFESLVDKYIMVTDMEDGDAYLQVISDGEFDDDGNQYARVVGVDFVKTVHTTPINFMIKNNYERAYCFLIPQRVAWLNRVLTKSAYINFADWSETMSEEDKLIIECLQRYPNLKVGEKFEVDSFCDQEVREIHPRNWTIVEDNIYLAKFGEGGAHVYKKTKDDKIEWAERTSVKLAPPPGVIYYNSTAPSTEIFIPTTIEKTPLLNKKSKIKQLKLN